MHDGLEDGGEWGDADARGDEDGVLGAEEVAGGSTEGSIEVDLKARKFGEVDKIIF